MIEGIGIQLTKKITLQEAIEAAGAAYRRKFGTAPTHVSLPAGTAVDGLNLWTLQIGRPTSTQTSSKFQGTVVVGRLVPNFGNGNSRGAKQLGLFSGVTKNGDEFGTR